MASIVDFIEENYEELLVFAVKLNGNWADGEDVLQTVAVKICAWKSSAISLKAVSSTTRAVLRLRVNSPGASVRLRGVGTMSYLGPAASGSARRKDNAMEMTLICTLAV